MNKGKDQRLNNRLSGAGKKMKKTTTTRYDVAEHLRTPEEMAAYLETCFEEANGNAAFIAKALDDIVRDNGMSFRGTKLKHYPKSLIQRKRR